MSATPPTAIPLTGFAHLQTEKSRAKNLRKNGQVGQRSRVPALRWLSLGPLAGLTMKRESSPDAPLPVSQHNTCAVQPASTCPATLCLARHPSPSRLRRKRRHGYALHLGLALSLPYWTPYRPALAPCDRQGGALRGGVGGGLLRNGVHQRKSQFSILSCWQISGVGFSPTRICFVRKDKCVPRDLKIIFRNARALNSLLFVR